MMQQYLYLMLGYPGSGKSYFSEGLAKQTGIVRFNSDQLRHYLFEHPIEHHTAADRELIVGAMNSATASVLRAGHSVVCDLNNNFIHDRKVWREIANEYGAQTVIVWIKTPLDIAIERGRVRPVDEESIRVTPEWVMRVAEEIEPPLESELCIEIDGKMDFKDQYDSFSDQLATLYKESSLVSL